MYQYFVGVCHHGEIREAEFAEWLWALEDFLLTPLVRRTFDDFDAIDALIQEGEADAQ